MITIFGQRRRMHRPRLISEEGWAWIWQSLQGGAAILLFIAFFVVLGILPKPRPDLPRADAVHLVEQGAR